MGTNIGAKNSYKKVTLPVQEIRDASIQVHGKNGLVFIGRSLLSYLSDERISNYRGPLPMEFALEIAAWRVNQGDL